MVLGDGYRAAQDQIRRGLSDHPPRLFVPTRDSAAPASMAPVSAVTDHTPPRGARIWDLPTRLFHWLLTAAVSVSLYTGLSDNSDMDLHLASGYIVFALLLFRLGWGMGGATYARFAQFASSPRAAWDYLRRFRSVPEWAGHNPAASWAIFALLLALTAQVTTGLFSTDDVLTEGPLRHLVGDDTSSTLSWLHKRNAVLVLTLVGIHLLGVLVHLIVRRERLLRAMITGDKPVVAAATRYSWVVAVALAAASIGTVYAVVHWL